MHKINVILWLLMSVFINAKDIFVTQGNENSTEGQGTEQSPYLSLRYAVNRAENGDVIKLLSDIVYRSDAHFIVDKELIFDGQGQFGIQFRGGNLELLANTTFRNLGLRFLPSIGSVAKIYVSDYTVTFDNVNTRLSLQQPSERPIIFAGSYNGRQGGTHAKIITLNATSEMRFKKIIAGSERGAKQTPTTISLTGFAISDEGVELSGQDALVNAQVEVYSESRNIRKIVNTHQSSQNKVQVSNISLYNAEFRGIKDFSVVNANINIGMTNFEGFSGELSLDARSSLTLNNNSFSMTMGAILGEGSIKLPLIQHPLAVSGHISDNLRIEIGNIGDEVRYPDYLGEVMLSAQNGNPNLSLYNDDQYTFEKKLDNGKYVWTLKDPNQAQTPQEENYEMAVGINTATPQATLDIREVAMDSVPVGATQGVLFPSFTSAERAKFRAVEEGTMIYNKDQKCLEIYINKNWKCITTK